MNQSHVPQCAKNMVIVYNFSLQLLLREWCDYNFILDTCLSSILFLLLCRGVDGITVTATVVKV